MHSRRSTLYTLSLIASLCACTSTRADAPIAPAIDLHDLPDSDGEWQEGVALIAAPQETVRYWLTDYAAWSQRFPDMEWSEVLPDDERGRHLVRFRSRIANCVFLIAEEVQPGLLVFDGFAPHIHTQGRIYLVPEGPGRTRVLMQSTAEVHGFIGLFATKGYKRSSAFKVTRSHLTALLALAKAKP